MYVSAIRIQGLRGAEGFEATALGRVVDLAPGPEGVAVADALTLLAASLPAKTVVTGEPDGVHTARALVSLGLATSPGDVQMLVEGGFPVQATLATSAGVPALLPIGGARQITVAVEVELDPPLFGRLRSLAARDPRLVTALGEGSHVSVKVGWLFTNDLLTASISVLGLAIGDTAFPVTGSERPAWFADLCRDLGWRFGRVDWQEPIDRVSERLLEAALSVDADRRGRFREASRALASPPYRYGALELVRMGTGSSARVEPCFGPGLLRARQFGPPAVEALRLAEAVYLQAPDVLVVEAAGGSARDPSSVREWLSERASGDDATLEQVFMIAGGAAVEPGVA